MKKMNLHTMKRYYYRRIHAEDLRILQKKLSGASVYGAVRKAYRRLPKHRKTYLFQ